ncbi:MAG: type II secretion system minor pseudopilin GspI [Thioalkalivibrionaceae bacterium]
MTDSGRRPAARVRSAVPAGFTLLEVLVALAILATALAAVIQAAGAHARNAAVLSERAIAGWIAADLAADLAAGQVRASATRSRTTRVSAEREWVVEWQATPLEVDAPLPLPRIQRVEIVVSDPSGRVLHRGVSYAF